MINSLKSKDFSSMSWTSFKVDTTIWSYFGFQSYIIKKVRESVSWFHDWQEGYDRITSSFKRTCWKVLCWGVLRTCMLFIFQVSFFFYLYVSNVRFCIKNTFCMIGICNFINNYHLLALWLYNYFIAKDNNLERCSRSAQLTLNFW